MFETEARSMLADEPCAAARGGRAAARRLVLAVCDLRHVLVRDDGSGPSQWALRDDDGHAGDARARGTRQRHGGQRGAVPPPTPVRRRSRLAVRGRHAVAARRRGALPVGGRTSVAAGAGLAATARRSVVLALLLRWLWHCGAAACRFGPLRGAAASRARRSLAEQIRGTGAVRAAATAAARRCTRPPSARSSEAAAAPRPGLRAICRARQRDRGAGRRHRLRRATRSRAAIYDRRHAPRARAAPTTARAARRRAAPAADSDRPRRTMDSRWNRR